MWKDIFFFVALTLFIFGFGKLYRLCTADRSKPRIVQANTGVLYDRLLVACLGDHQAANRLIKYEYSLESDLSADQATQIAIDRLKADRGRRN